MTSLNAKEALHSMKNNFSNAEKIQAAKRIQKKLEWRLQVQKKAQGEKRYPEMA